MFFLHRTLGGAPYFLFNPSLRGYTRFMYIDINVTTCVYAHILALTIYYTSLHSLGAVAVWPHHRQVVITGVSATWVIAAAAPPRMFSSAANRLIGEVVQSRRRPLLGPSPG